MLLMISVMTTGPVDQSFGAESWYFDLETYFSSCESPSHSPYLHIKLIKTADISDILSVVHPAGNARSRTEQSAPSPRASLA